MFGRKAAEKRVPRVETLETPDQAARWLNKLETNLNILQNRANVILDEELTRKVSRSPDSTAGAVRVGDLVLKKPSPYEKSCSGKLSNSTWDLIQFVRLKVTSLLSWMALLS